MYWFPVIDPQCDDPVIVVVLIVVSGCAHAAAPVGEGNCLLVLHHLSFLRVRSWIRQPPVPLRSDTSPIALARPLLWPPPPRPPASMDYAVVRRPLIH